MKNYLTVFLLLICLLFVSCGSPKFNHSLESSKLKEKEELFSTDEPNSTSKIDESESQIENNDVDDDIVDYMAPLRNIKKNNDLENDLDFNLKRANENPDVETTLFYHTEEGTAVFSPIEGTITKIQLESEWPKGKYVVIQSSENEKISVRLEHLSSISEDLSSGDAVNTDTQIALAGSTGATAIPAVGVNVIEGEYPNNYRLVSIEHWDRVFLNWPNCMLNGLNE